MGARKSTQCNMPLSRFISSRYAYAVFAFLLTLRVANALSVQTFFQPDEYFQSLEPASQIAFGSDSGA